MDHTPTTRFRRRLWWMVALLLALLVLLVVATILSSRYQHEAQAEAEASSVASVLESDIQGLVDKLKFALEVLGVEVSQARSGKPTDEARSRAYLARIHKSLPDVEAFRVFDVEGRLVLATDIAEDTPATLEGEPYLEQLRNARPRGIAIFLPHRHGANSDPVIDFVLALRGPDEMPTGFVIAHFSRRRLDRMLSAADVGSKGAVSLHGEGLELIARRPPLPETTGKAYGPKELQKFVASGQTSGSFHTVTPADGVERLFSFRKVAGYPLYVTVARATSDYLGHWRRDMGVVVMLAGILSAVIVGAAVVIDWAWRRQERAARVLELQAHTDVLTGLANRRRFFEMAEAEMARTKRYDAPLSVLMLDIDHFKKVNDTFGHHAGDEVLKQLARTVLGVLRNVDIAGRIGGEEFAILLPETTLEGAVEVAERLRLAVEKSAVPREAGAPLRYTISLGVTTLAGDANLDVLMSQADTAMYEAKRAGRNRVVKFPAAS